MSDAFSMLSFLPFNLCCTCFLMCDSWGLLSTLWLFYLLLVLHLLESRVLQFHFSYDFSEFITCDHASFIACIH